jgi:transcriptional regulator with XRE-family HTH domain
VIDLGNKLKAARESLGLSLNQVSDKTKIRSHILENLENGNFSVLPPPYLISFIKTYTSFLRFPEDDIELIVEEIRAKSKLAKPETYQQHLNTPVKKEPMPITPKAIGKRMISIQNANIINYLIYSSIGLIVIVVIWLTFFMDSSESKKFSGELDKKPDTAVVKGVGDNLEAFFTQRDSIILEAYGKDTAWIRIVMDGQKADQVTIYPEKEYQWSAMDNFLISIGNEGAVIFKRDGVELPAFGTKGTVIRNIRITRDNIEISSAPWAEQDSVKRKMNKKKKEKPVEEIRFLEPSNVSTEQKKIK